MKKSERLVVRAGAGALAAAALLLCAGCREEEPPALQRYQTAFVGSMDTVVRFTAYCADSAAFDRACQLVEDELERADARYNIYRPDSELAHVNAAAGEGPVPVDPALAGAIETCRALQEKTAAVNIAMGSALSLWHTAREEGVPPEEAAVQEAMRHTSMEAVKVSAQGEEATVELADPAMSLDMGCVAKGLAAQDIADRLKESGVTCFLLDCGTSTLVCAGSPPDRTGWIIGVSNPDASLNLSGREDPPDTLGRILVQDGCVGTSGDYQKYFVKDGISYSHILDAATGQPAAYVRAVTVLAPDAGLADFYSTALFAQPYEQARQLAEATPGLEALWVFRDGSMEATSGFAFYAQADAGGDG